MKFDFLRLAPLLAALPLAASAQQAPLAGDAERGSQSASMCIGCHSIPGYQASFPRVYRVPKIGGQEPGYIQAALQAYKRGDRNHPSMSGVARGLSDQQMADLAAYYSERGTGKEMSK
jgi:cytochrome c553